MKTFEEKYTAWVDGLLSVKERTSFERENPALAGDKLDQTRLRSLLQAHLRGPALPNADFLNSEILRNIRAEAPGRRGIKAWWRLPHWIAAGATAIVLLGSVLFLSQPPVQKFDYLAQVLKTKTSNPNVTATVDAQKDMTVIRVDGLEKVPPEKELSR